MKITSLLGITAVIVAGALFAACGGSDSPAASTGGTNNSQTSSKITTQHGLAVAALVANFSGDKSDSSQTSDLAESASGGSSSSGSGVAAPAAINGADGSSSAIAGEPQTSATQNTGITVNGYGMASADADSAIVQFYFSSYSNAVPPVEPITAPDLKPTVSTGTVSPITQEDLQPVINALTNAGVAASDIQFVGQGYYDGYNASATLSATINDVDSLDSTVEAAQNASNNLDDITLQSTNVSYTLQDCSALEKAAMDAAVGDAGDRAGLLADSLHVTLGSVTGATDNSYSPSGVPCSGSNYWPYPMYNGVAFDSIKAAGGSASNAVQVVATITVTYAMS